MSPLIYTLNVLLQVSFIYNGLYYFGRFDLRLFQNLCKKQILIANNQILMSRHHLLLLYLSIYPLASNILIEQFIYRCLRGCVLYSKYRIK